VTGASGQATERTSGSRLGRLPVVTLCAAVGLLVCTIAQALSRATLDPPLSLYWLGLLLIVAPIFFRLTSQDARQGERLALVSLLGLALYGAKVVRDSFVFGFADEPVHAFNAEQIADHGRLFVENSILEVTPFYPGLEGATSALMSLTGLPSFGAGLVVVGAARLLMVVALFVLFRRISGSPRAAGLGVAVYVGSFNFLYFSAQYSYESLSLPLFVAILAVLAERGASMRREAARWTAPLAILIAAVVVVHHLTSYAVVITLAALSLLTWRLRRDAPNPWPFAVLALGLTATWLVVVASTTVGYLTPVLDNALDQAVDTVRGTEGPRALFEAEDTSVGPDTTPLVARGVAVAAIAALFAGFLLGLRYMWPRLRDEPFAVLFAAAGLAFFASLTLRFVPAAWETGNRASGFFFLGLAFVVVYALFDRRFARLRTLASRSAVTAALALVFVGGVISGWPWDLHLSLPSRASADGGRIESEPLGLARWAREHLPEGRYAAGAADARRLLDPGGAYAVAGRDAGVEEILAEPTLASWHLPALRREDVRYVVADRREASEDAIRGYALSVRPEAGVPDELRPLNSSLKFETVYNEARILDSGRIVLYDLLARPRP
jgi:hypothetical protein